MTATVMTATGASRSGIPRVTPEAAMLVTGLATGILVTRPSGLRLALAGGAGLVLLVAAVRLPIARALPGLVIWLVILGLVRRLASGMAPAQAWGDPLLLVGSGMWAILTVRAIRSGGLRRRTPLTQAALALGGLLAVSALNPAQGGLVVGLSGALLVVVPMGAFLVGRSVVDDESFSRLVRLAAWLGVGAAAYGLIQTFWGMPWWDRAWVDTGGYAALSVGGVIRAFSSFSAASEYAGFLGIAVVAWAAGAWGRSSVGVTAAALGVVGAALWYESSRAIIVLTLVSVGLMLSARAGLPLGGAIAVGVAIVVSLPTVIGWLAPPDGGDDPASLLARHQVEGFADPFGEGSTLQLHLEMVRNGVLVAFEEPLGRGVGSVTISGGKYGGVVANTEADPGNAPVAAGLPGLLAYVAVVALGLPRAYRLAALQQDPASLAALGILVVTFLQWLNGGHYAVSFWPWLALGWLDGGSNTRMAAAPDREQDRVGL